jgi:hypothetical protein
MLRVMGHSPLSKARQSGKSWWMVYLEAAAGAESIDNLALLTEETAPTQRSTDSIIAQHDRSGC